MCSDIMYHVAGCRPDLVAATLQNYRRSRIRGEEYPGIIADAGSEVAGILYLNLPDSALQRLDEFEGEQYTRQELQVITEQGSSCAAMAYVIKSQHSHLLTGETWSYEHFLAHGKSQFLSTYIGFHKIQQP